ncbi:MAG: NADH:ubiquinone oxidoreductase [Roseovarius pacificus]|nr:NADH:ubiquinone oxidoreductase [Roseovarius pacificus]
MCRIVCWAIAAIVGVLVLWGTTSAVGFVAALLAGAAVAVFLGLVLTRLFCGAVGQPVAASHAVKDTATDVADKVKTVAADTAKVAGDAGEKAAAAAKDATGDIAKAAKSAKDAAGDAVEVAKASGKDTIPDYDGDGVKEGTEEGSRPESLSAPRGGKADDLKQIKGVGPKLELLCNELGFYHFDQIAGWGVDEVAWVDANLKGFRGRVSRDNWVEQARILAGGGETEFSKRVEDGDVY